MGCAKFSRMWLDVRHKDDVQRGSLSLLPFHTSPSLFSDEFQVAAGHYIMSRNFDPIQDAFYWDAEFPDKVYRGFFAAKFGRH